MRDVGHSSVGQGGRHEGQRGQIWDLRGAGCDPSVPTRGPLDGFPQRGAVTGPGRVARGQEAGQRGQDEAGPASRSAGAGKVE